jgi:hypothetical protein
MNFEIEKNIRELLKQARKSKNGLELMKIEKEIEKLYREFQESEFVAVTYLILLKKMKHIRDENFQLHEFENKAEEVFMQHQTSEEVASNYLNFLTWGKYKPEDGFIVEDLLKRGKKVYEQHYASEKISLEYLSYLKRIVNLSRDDATSNEILIQCDEVYRQHRISPKIALEYLEILQRLIVISNEISLLKEICNQGKKVYEDHKESEEVIQLYINLLSRLSYDLSEEQDLQGLLRDADEIYKQNQKSELVAKTYLEFLARLEYKQDIDFLLEELVRRGDEVYKKHHTTEEIVLTYLSFLWRVDWRNDDYVLFQELLSRGKNVYKEHQSSEEIVTTYLIFLWNIDPISFDVALSFELLKQGEEVYEQHKDSERVTLLYLEFLIRLSTGKDNESLIKEIENKGRNVYKHTNTSPIVVLTYFSFLLELYKQENSEQNIEFLEEEADEIYLQNLKSKSVEELESISFRYVSFLVNLSYYKDEISDLESITKKIGNVYRKNPSSQKVLAMYCKILEVLSTKYQNSKDLKQIAKKVKKIVDKIRGIAIGFEPNNCYIQILSKLSLKQNKEPLLKETANEAKKIFERYNWNSSFKNEYIRILLNWALSQDEMSKIDVITEEIINLCSKKKMLRTIIEIFMDELLMTKMNIAKNQKSFSMLLTSFFIQGSNKNPLNKTKYDGLFNLIKRKSEAEVNVLIDIFSLVQIIKNQLIVKNPEKLRFGHYTTGEVLQKYLKQENEEFYAIRVKSRLNNVDYMNDPSEGKVLNQYLQVDLTDQKLYLKPTPWFLMSLTTAIDKLTMWAQYGDNAKGVCLVLQSSDFTKVSNSSGIPPLIELAEHSETESEENSGTESENISSEKNQKSKDVIYRIGYLTSDGSADTLLEKEHNTCLSSDEIIKLNSSLTKLKRKVDKIDKDSKLYEAIDESLEEIRYLFKSTDYSYEAELRLLKYSPLDYNNKSIKINDKGDVAKLYIERENPIKIEEVIFGPKFPNPQNVTPLLHLLDKNIKFSQSKIPFK